MFCACSIMTIQPSPFHFKSLAIGRVVYPIFLVVPLLLFNHHFPEFYLVSCQSFHASIAILLIHSGKSLAFHCVHLEIFFPLLFIFWMPESTMINARYIFPNFGDFWYRQLRLPMGKMIILGHDHVSTLAQSCPLICEDKGCGAWSCPLVGHDFVHFARSCRGRTLQPSLPSDPELRHPYLTLTTHLSFILRCIKSATLVYLIVSLANHRRLIGISSERWDLRRRFRGYWVLGHSGSYSRSQITLTRSLPLKC